MAERAVTVRIHDEGDGNGLWAEVVELPGLFVSGDTTEELQEALREALELYFEAKVTSTKWADERIVERSVLLEA